jgi:hypothetical protein
MCFTESQNLAILTVERGSKLQSIGEFAFRDCQCLQVVDLPPNLQALSSDLFGECDLFVLPLESLSQLSIIKSHACRRNLHLRSVWIPGSVAIIDEYAFVDCFSLSEVKFELPSKLRTIGSGSFSGCQSLARFRFVGSVEEIGGSFLNRSGVHEIIVDEDNDHFKVIDGFLANRQGTRIIHYFGSECDIRIGRDIETVCEHSFRGCECLRSVTFEKGSRLAVVEESAFQECLSLERVEFEALRPIFDDYCFADCGQLKDVLFAGRPDRFALNDYAFVGCPVLEVVVNDDFGFWIS